MIMIDLTKPVQTRDGREVELWDKRIEGSMYSVTGIVTPIDGKESFQSWTLEGKILDTRTENGGDLVNVPEKHRAWINIYPGTTASYKYETKRDANSNSNTSCIACVEIEFTEGEGL